MDESGNVKKDSYRITFIRCCHGTNMVEAIHRLYNALFKHRSGTEMEDAKAGTKMTPLKLGQQAENLLGLSTS
jgi:hypothetical protein